MLFVVIKMMIAMNVTEDLLIYKVVKKFPMNSKSLKA